MSNMGVMRARCYLILAGLERSIGESLSRNFEVTSPSFLQPEESERALWRLREDMQDQAWTLQDVGNVDLLPYLDLGDLLGLCNRHKSTVRNAQPAEVEVVTKVIQEYGTHAIRKRVMHPVRPLEAGDYNALLTLAQKLPDESPSLSWEPLVESVSLIEDPRNIADTALPRFWMDESRTVNNLPVPEFEDTGFIGRADERRRLKTLILSDHKVITVVGAGGIGKTALAMRVCHDILDDTSTRFDNVIWVSLKTQFLTGDGIRHIRDAVDTQSKLLDHIATSANIPIDQRAIINWAPVVDHMSRYKTLLVIDNLETLGTELKELAFEVPQGSKLLLTSRVGLGEIERRFDIPDFSAHDSEILMRVLGNAYGYSEIKQLDGRMLNRYCRRLHHNPLLIKWFVQAVGKGASARDILAHQDFNAALSFCFANVYSNLPQTALTILHILLAGRRALSQAQIRELIGVDRISFDVALLDLRQSNAIETLHHEDGSTLYQISGLILDYLSKNHPPSDDVVMKTRESLRKWQIEQDRSASAQNVYRYSKRYVLVETIDHRIAASSLREALQEIHATNPTLAETALNRASELTPDWSEVYRVRAHLLKLQQRPIYEIENAFEDSVRYGENDLNRRDYATYLMGFGEHERALNQIEAALELGTGVETVLRSLRALALTRLSRVEEALKEYEFVWTSKERNQSQYDRIVQGTQYADAYRRYVEQLTGQGKRNEVEEATLAGVRIVEETAADCGWDNKLAQVAIKLLGETIDHPNASPEFRRQLVEVATKWDATNAFVRCCNLQRTLDEFTRHGSLTEYMPNSSRTILSADGKPRFHGTVNRLLGSLMAGFGFITCNELGSVHMQATSLIQPDSWSLLKVGQPVSFSVVKQAQGFHAIGLEATHDL